MQRVEIKAEIIQNKFQFDMDTPQQQVNSWSFAQDQVGGVHQTWFFKLNGKGKRSVSSEALPGRAHLHLVKTVSTIQTDSSEGNPTGTESPAIQSNTSALLHPQLHGAHCRGTCWTLHRAPSGHWVSGMILRHRPRARRRRSEGETVTRILGFCTTSKL